MRRRPELPRGHTGLVPGCPPARTAIAPDVPMPAIAIDGLPADAAEAVPAPMLGLAIGRRRRPEMSRKSVATVDVESPRPSVRSARLRCERAREPVGAQRMRLPIGLHGL